MTGANQKEILEFLEKEFENRPYRFYTVSDIVKGTWLTERQAKSSLRSLRRKGRLLYSYIESKKRLRGSCVPQYMPSVIVSFLAT